MRELKWGSPLQGACLWSSKVAGRRMVHDAIAGTARVCILSLEYATLSAIRFSIGFRFILFLLSGSRTPSFLIKLLVFMNTSEAVYEKVMKELDEPD